jgi:PAS domain S-box-containing protein
VKLLTAAVSVTSAILLTRLIPRALAHPGTAVFDTQLRSANARVAELAAALDRTQSLVRGKDGIIRHWSLGAETMYGWSKEEAVGRRSHELLGTEFPRPLAEIEDELWRNGSWSGELKHRRRDGGELWVASHWILGRNSGDGLESIVEVNNDITATKQAEAALSASDAQANSLLENAVQGIITVDSKGTILRANLMLKRMFGYNRGELIGKSVDLLLPEALRGRHSAHRDGYFSQPRARPMGLGMDLVGRRKDGSEFPVEISLNNIPGPEAGLVMAFVSDITARQQAARERETLVTRLETALAEKIVLLQEVHHRVKNNLATIAGLLDMQAAAVEDEHAATALADSEQRVLSMALIHEYLYSTENLDRIDLADYAQQLADQLAISFSVEPQRVRLRVEAEPIQLRLDRAIPCGLILNELITNALKYAFPEEAGGEILIRFAHLDAGWLRLSVEDDGVGMPAGFEWESARSLGLKIVMILAKQIGGELSPIRNPVGAGFSLTFPACP